MYKNESMIKQVTSTLPALIDIEILIYKLVIVITIRVDKQNKQKQCEISHILSRI